MVDAGPILTSVARGGLLKAAGIRAAWSEPGAASLTLTQGDGLPGRLEIALLLRFLDPLSLPRPSERQVTAKKPCPKTGLVVLLATLSVNTGARCEYSYLPAVGKDLGFPRRGMCSIVKP